MPTLLTIEGLDDLANRGPGKRQSKPRGFREVVEVQPSRKDPSICVAARFGGQGAAGGRRMADLCREAGLDRMRVAGRIIALGAGDGDMADYSETEFPPIEDLEDLDALIPSGYVMDSLVAIGANLAARTLGDATNALPGPTWIRPLVKVAAGLAGGRALWGVNRDAGLMVTGTLLGGALYDNLLRPMVLSRFPQVFGESVDLPEERILGQLTDEERALLDGSVEEDASDRGRDLSAGVEEEDVISDDVDDDDSRRSEVEVSSLGQWLQ